MCVNAYVYGCVLMCMDNYVGMCMGVDLCGCIIMDNYVCINNYYVWTCDVCGFVSTCMYARGCVCMDNYDCVDIFECVRMDVYGCIWMCMDVHGCVWMWVHVYG